MDGSGWRWRKAGAAERRACSGSESGLFLSGRKLAASLSLRCGQCAVLWGCVLGLGLDLGWVGGADREGGFEFLLLLPITQGEGGSPTFEDPEGKRALGESRRRELAAALKKLPGHGDGPKRQRGRS